MKKNKTASVQQVPMKIRDLLRQYLDEGPAKQDYAIDHAQLQHLIGSFSGMYGIIDFTQRKYLYISDTVYETLGIEPEVFLSDGISAVMATFVPEEAVLFVEVIYPTMFQYFQQYALEGSAIQMKVGYTTRLKITDGTYKWYLHQIVPLRLDSKGMPITALKLLLDVEGLKKDNNIDLIISKKDDKGIYRIIHEKSVMPRKDEWPITEREREVLFLASQGLSAKEISKELFISQHTVINHKKNMLKKLNMGSTSELVRFGMVNGIIG